MILEVEELSKSFGGLKGTDNVSFAIKSGEISAIIGPNGAGKSTLFNLLSGYIRPDKGRVIYHGKEITHLPPHEISHMGIGRSFQVVNTFPRLSTFENIQLALLCSRGKINNISSSARHMLIDETEEILRIVKLLDKSPLPSGSLAHGDQKRLEIGIALGGEPDLLLLDEPTAGMSPEDSMDFAGFIARIAREKFLTVIFVEHDMNVVFSISDYIRVLHQGALIAGGSPEEIRENEEVQRVYMEGAEIVSRPKKDERAEITLPSREVHRLLNVEGIDTFYGSSHILFNVSLQVNKGEVVCLLGRNGVGKTTTLRSIMGLTAPRKGYIRFLNQDIVGRQPFQIAKKGMGYVPGERGIFPDLTVMENLEMAKKPGPGGDSWDVQRIFEIFPKLKTRQTQKGGTLSGGEQQMLTIARSLMGNPLLLLLDEPSEGLAPKVVKMLFEQLSRLKEQGMSMLICEQNLNFALMLSDRAYILEKGQVCWKGSTKELSAKPEIMKQHLSV